MSIREIKGTILTISLREIKGKILTISLGEIKGTILTMSLGEIKGKILTISLKGKISYVSLLLFCDLPVSFCTFLSL
jgi:hypothetical protein